MAVCKMWIFFFQSQCVNLVFFLPFFQFLAVIIIVFIMQVIVGILVFHYRNKVSIVWVIVGILVLVYRNEVRYNILWVFFLVDKPI